MFQHLAVFQHHHVRVHRTRTETAPSHPHLTQPGVGLHTPAAHGPSAVLYFIKLINPVGNCGRLSTAAARAALPVPTSVCSICVVWLPMCGVLYMHTDVMDSIAHGDCTNTVRESAQKCDPGRKMPCPTGDSNPPRPALSVPHSAH